MKGKFVTFEGCEGVGKTTQIELLKKYLADTNQESVFLREPGGNKISENIRSLILSVDSQGMTSRCEAMLYASARAQLVEQVIAPLLDQDKLVICDRFIDSTFAYQGVARNLGQDFVMTLNNLACGQVVPQVTIFLDLSPKLGFERKGGADKDDRLEQENIQFHQKVYEGYLIASEKFADRIVKIDAKGDIESIHNNILQVLRDKGIIK